MLIKVIKSYREIIAICDSDLLGKKFEQGKFQLDVKESFYKGKEMPDEEAIKTMKLMAKEDATFNIVGKASVSAALKAGIISEQGIKTIQGVPFAMALL
jgi:hypothetical protein